MMVTGQMNLNLMPPSLETITAIDGQVRLANGGEVPTVDVPKVTEASRARKYLPTLSDLVDRLTIVQQKAIFIHERKTEYVAEMALIMHDIDLILSGLERPIRAREIHAIIILMLANRYIWEQESIARNGGDEHDKNLKATHSVNGVRNTAKNVLAEIDGGRHDYKIDAFAESLIPQFGNWSIF